MRRGRWPKKGNARVLCSNICIFVNFFLTRYIVGVSCPSSPSERNFMTMVNLSIVRCPFCRGEHYGFLPCRLTRCRTSSSRPRPFCDKPSDNDPLYIPHTLRGNQAARRFRNNPVVLFYRSDTISSQSCTARGSTTILRIGSLGFGHQVLAETGRYLIEIIAPGIL